MVEEEKYCIDILTQVSAMTKALQAVSLGLLEEHLNHCVVDAARAGDEEAPREGHRGRRRHRPPRPLLTAPSPERRPHREETHEQPAPGPSPA